MQKAGNAATVVVIVVFQYRDVHARSSRPFLEAL